MNSKPSLNQTWSRDTYPHLWFPYCQQQTARCPELVVGAEAEFLELADGRRLIDAISSWWTACHGYNHPHIAAAVASQLSQLPHVMMGGLCNEQVLKLSVRLARLLPGDLSRMFFCDSGSVAVEVAMKIAVQYCRNQGFGERNRFISFRNSYHGDTAGAMSVCDPVDSMHAHFKGYLLEQFPAPIPTGELEFEQLEQFVLAQRDRCAGMIIEPLVQMAAGMKFHSVDVLRRTAQVAKSHGLLLIADEIGTGFGRLGGMFACQLAGVEPDLMCIGKALTGGTLGMAVTAATNRVYSAFESDQAESALMHGPTFMGNALAAAASNASLDLFEMEPRLEQVARIEQRFAEFAERQASRPQVLETNVRGALLAIRTDRALDKNAAMEFFAQRGIWLRTINDTVYLAPPFVIEDASLQVLFDAVDCYLQEGI